MSVLPVGFGSAVASGYQIERSLRFNSADTAYLNRTPASAGNLQTWTWSGWVKRSRLGVDNETIFALFDYLASPTTNKQHGLRFLSGDTIEYWCYQDPSYNGRKITTQVFRDVSAWYHIVAVWDTPNATAANRMRLYVNGSEVTAFGTNTNPTQNSNGEINRAFLHTIGTFYDPDYGSPITSLNGYLTEINFVDGQALTPSSFGETDSNTGVWKPKAYTGTYGTNGFYLKFADNSNTTAATLGKDSSGNGNNWTPNNFSVTAGAGNDSLVDSPTSYGTDTGVGGEVRGNYATLNPLKSPGGNGSTFNGNLNVSTLSGDGYYSATMLVSSGKWYAEITPTYLGTTSVIGVVDANKVAPTSYPNLTAFGWVYQSNANKANNNSTVSYGASWAANDVIGIALDMDAGTVTFYKNGVSQGQAYSGITGDITFCCYDGSSANYADFTCNFGQRAFAYTAPSGFKALCTQNLPTPTIGATSTTQANDYFNVVLYTGTGSSLGVTGVGFQPDWTWIKGRSGATDHGLYDAVRGVQKQLESNTTTAETTETTGLTAFNSDGFTVGALAQLNTSSATYVAWNWKANGAGSSNTAGSITSTVSANTTSGFSIVTAPVTSAGGTIGHGLGVSPAMIIMKNRDDSGTNWGVWHQSLSSTQYLLLNATNAVATSSTIFNGVSSTTFTIGSGWVGSGTKSHVAYCFAPVAGYSAFGSYTGNGSTDGPFVYLGFRPRYVMVKRTDTTASWAVVDTARDPYNATDKGLIPNTSDAEGTGYTLDYLSNGFKMRLTGTAYNASGGTYIYAAFAESPFKYSLAR